MCVCVIMRAFFFLLKSFFPEVAFDAFWWTTCEREERAEKRQKRQKEREVRVLFLSACVSDAVQIAANKLEGRARVDSSLHIKERNVQSLTTFSVRRGARMKIGFD